MEPNEPIQASTIDASGTANDPPTRHVEHAMPPDASSHSLAAQSERQNTVMPFRLDVTQLKVYYEICFQQIQLESTLINYRFVWCMFANGALMTLYVNSSRFPEVVQAPAQRWIAVLAGISFNVLSWSLIRMAVKAQRPLYVNAKMITAAWKDSVTPEEWKYWTTRPNVADKPSDWGLPMHPCPYGGGRDKLGLRADQVLHLVSAIFVAVWTLLMPPIIQHISQFIQQR